MIGVTHETIEALELAFKEHNFEPLLKELAPEIRQCEDCESIYTDGDGGYYKYEQGVWLCDSCQDSRMEEDNE